MGGISPRPALAIPPPAKTKESNNKGQKKNEQTTPQGANKRERGVIAPFLHFLGHFYPYLQSRGSALK